MPQEKIVLLGCGDIAMRLAPHLMNEQVVGVRRSANTQRSIPIEVADCRDQGSMNTLMARGFDVVVMTFTPTEMSDIGYQAGYVDTVKTVVTALKNQSYQPRLIVFVSSTSVYGQQDASWVNEDSPTEPVNYSGRRLLEAEQLLVQSGYPSCCVRFSGIYGPGRRRLIDQVMAASGSAKEPILYSNRIHADDCAAVLAHLIEQQKSQTIDSLYLATDCEPVPLYDVKQWLAKALGFSSDYLIVDNNSPNRMLRGSKRCLNKKLMDSGYQFRYPTFREGYQMMLDEM
ncbi:MAG: nucleoside-diphosphate-sugar epimerase [Kiritimatiellia bacterium]|jgi:nucleoside-diphosphate-sugar epimerase